MEYRNIIDDKVYGKRRMLRIEGSTKLNSDRRKIYIDQYENNVQIIKLDGLITNLENTELLYTNLYIPNINKKIDYNCKEKCVVLKQNKQCFYTKNDIDIINNKYKNIVFIVNKWHYDNIKSKNLNDIFIFNYILNNMIILKRIKAFFCPDCKRIHEKQHPYAFIINSNLFFHCRRSLKPIKINIDIKNIIMDKNIF